MRVLVLLVAVSYCSAQLVLPYTAPWVLPSAKLTTTADSDDEPKTVAIHTPYIGHPYLHPNTYTHPLATPYLHSNTYTHPLATPYLHPNAYTHPLATPYLHPNAYTHPLASPYLHPYGYTINTDGALKATEFPFVYEAVKSEEPAAEEEATPAVEEARRRRRDVQAVHVPLPYVHAIPAITKKTIETKQFETADAATPADTTKIELITRKHEIAVPAVRYVQPVVKYQPLTYTAISPAVLPYHHVLPAYSAFPYPLLHSTPLIKLKKD